jgi:hypothetical protein
MRLLEYWGVTSLVAAPDAVSPDANLIYLTPANLPGIAGIINASMQDIFEQGPAALSQVRQGANLFAPANITINVTSGSTTTTPTGFVSWMNGCTVVIQGDAFANEFVDGAGTLLRPYLGTTATGVPAVVYCDSVQLASNVKNVVEPVNVVDPVIPGPYHRPLQACLSRDEFDNISYRNFLWVGLPVQVGRPRIFLAESRYNAAVNYLPIFLRIAPAPLYGTALTFVAKLLPPTIGISDLGTDSSDPGTMLPIPGDWVDSILVPYCLQRMTGTPLFRREELIPEIGRQYKEARAKLESFKPQISARGGRFAFRP